MYFNINLKINCQQRPVLCISQVDGLKIIFKQLNQNQSNTKQGHGIYE